jgi:hypothetical protein
MSKAQPRIIPITAMGGESGPGSAHACREACAACCIAPSISSPIPGMPLGKPAGVACVQLTLDWRCALFGRPERPAVCGSLTPSPEMCGDTREQALRWLGMLESDTTPEAEPPQP